MVSVLTQNSALVNASNYTAIFVDKDDDNNIYIGLDQYVLGYYNSAQEAIDIMHWLAQELGNIPNGDSKTIVMPMGEQNETDRNVE